MVGAAPAAPVFATASATAYAAVPAVTTYAGFWVRFLAIIIDGLVVGVVTGPVVLIVEAMIGFGGGLLNDKGEINPGQIAMLAGTFAFIVAFSVAVKALYEALLTASSKQATVGKMVFRLKVTDLNGRRLSIPRAFGRHFAKYISGMTLLIGYLIQPFTERRQALHDIIASTLVVRDVSPPYQIVPPQTAPPPA
jgi:uncharacterized RDD family membrane protein YckC